MDIMAKKYVIRDSPATLTERGEVKYALHIKYEDSISLTRDAFNIN